MSANAKSGVSVTVQDRPIIFTGESVREILPGRKTQTRRVIIPQPIFVDEKVAREGYRPFVRKGWSWARGKRHAFASTESMFKEIMVREEAGFPFGKPGDRFWVQETWSNSAVGVYPCPKAWYRADFTKFDDPAVNHEHSCPPEYRDEKSRKYGNWADCFACAAGRESKFRWRSPRFMPRWASRLLLEVISIRVERLHEISVADCKKEGTGYNLNDIGWRYSLGSAWNQINEKRGFGWDTNPWVVVTGFRKLGAEVSKIET